MNSKTMNLVGAFVLGVTSSVWADPVVYTGKWTGNDIAWDNGWTDGNIAKITEVKNGEVNPSKTVKAYGVIFDTEVYCNQFWSDTTVSDTSLGRLWVGAGGMKFVKPAVFSLGNRSSSRKDLVVNGTQTWSGPEEGSAYADAVMATPAYYNGSYAKMQLSYAVVNQIWTIDNRLNLWMFSPNNNFPTMDMVIKAPARLYVAEDYKLNNTAQSAAVMKLQKLTLSGDGDEQLPLGNVVNYNLGGAGAPSSVGMVTKLTSNIAAALVLHDGADLTATKTTAFSIPSWTVSGTGESRLTGTFVFGNASTAVVLADGATLALAGTFEEANAGTTFSATGSGTVVLEMTGWHLTGGLSADAGISLDIRSDGGRFGSAISGTCALKFTVPRGEKLFVAEAELSGWTGKSLTVKGGCLMLDAPLPQDVVVTTEDGGSVVASGGLVVTDKIRTEATLVVPAGETLQVYGNGLTASTTVTLGDESKVCFHAAATVSSPIVLSPGSSDNWAYSYFYSSDASVTGFVAGAVSSGRAYSCAATDGPGCIVFSGGGAFTDNSRFEVHGGSSALLTGGVYHFGATGACCTYYRGNEQTGDWGRYLGIRDGGRVEFDEPAAQRNMFFAAPLRDSSNYKRSATIEIGEGGTVILPNKAGFYLGGNQNSGELIISGGTLKVGSGSSFCLGYNGYSIGTMRIRSGVFETSSPVYLKEDTNQSLVYWEGGTIKLGDGFTAGELVNGGLASDKATRKFSMGILGACTLDLTDLPIGSLYNIQTGTSNRGEWYGNGTLTVKGGKAIVMRSMPNDISLCLEGDGTKVIVENETRFFDYEKCAQYCKWRRPYSGGGPDNYDTKTLGLEVEGLSVKELSIADGAPSLLNTTASRTVVVADVEVAADGVWDNETSVDSALRDLTNMSLLENSIWRVTKRGENTVALSLGGVLSVPTRLRYLVLGSGLPVGETLLSGASTLASVPEWENAGTRLTAEPKLNDAHTGFLLAGGPGVAIIIK